MQGCRCFCVAHIDDRGQNVVLDFYQFSSIFGLLEGFSHHHRHVIAHIAHFAVGQDGVWGLLHGLTAGVGNQPAARKTVDLGVHHVGAIQNSHHTWRSQGCRLVNALDVGMRVRRTHKNCVRHVLQTNVVGVVTGTR